MLTNPFGKFLDLIVSWGRRHPKLGTWFIAFFLSGTWTIAWLAVFLFSTWAFDMSTKAADFANVFWLSIAAEAIIRCAENTNFAARMSKPYEENCIGENWDFSWRKASFLFCLIGFLMFILDKIMLDAGMNTPEFVYSTVAKRTGMADLLDMFRSWVHATIDSYVIVPLFLGTVFRAIIYKRPSSAPSTNN